jgi:hypothetical protein
MIFRLLHGELRFTSVNGCAGDAPAGVANACAMYRSSSAIVLHSVVDGHQSRGFRRRRL